jgi:osmotically-inducible protein OsmY
MNAKPLTAAFATVALVATLGLAACDHTKSASRDEQPTTVGQKIDNAIDRTQQKIQEAGDKTAQKLNEAADKTTLTLSDAGAKTEQAISAAGEKIAEKTHEAVSAVKGTGGDVTVTTTTDAPVSAKVSDAAITASIKTDLLKDPDLSVLKIDVDTKGGVVTLNGLANDEPSRQRAEKMANAVKGVKEVRNFLVVKRA